MQLDEKLRSQKFYVSCVCVCVCPALHGSFAGVWHEKRKNSKIFPKNRRKTGKFSWGATVLFFPCCCWESLRVGGTTKKLNSKNIFSAAILESV